MNKHLNVHFSSERQDWATPPQFIQWLNRRWGVEFDLDVAASDLTTKAPKWFTIDDDALSKDWFGNCWMNPPFGTDLVLFIKKAIFELSLENCDSVWILVPARTETKWFHDLVLPNADSVFLIRGRFQFIAGKGKTAAEGGNSPFPSALILMNQSSVNVDKCKIYSLDVPREIRGFKSRDKTRPQTTLGDF